MQEAKEIDMVLDPKGRSALVQCLIVALALLSWPRVGAAAGTWSVLSIPQQPGEVVSPTALAVDSAGVLYVADKGTVNGQIQRRDAQANWSVIAPQAQNWARHLVLPCSRRMTRATCMSAATTTQVRASATARSGSEMRRATGRR